MSYTEQLKDRVEEKWKEATGEDDAPSSGRGAFDPTIILTLVQAIIGFIQACRKPAPTPTPTPTPASAKKKAATAAELGEYAPYTIGLRFHVRREGKHQYGRDWKHVWREKGDKMMATARGVAASATNEEVEGLRREIREGGMSATFEDDDD